ncbi:DUF3224 domain-containing protein [Longibacter salinarum]|nr:DUF3224 domain-containing protein [Longibacter salinarum]
MKTTAHFDVTGWDPASSDQPDKGPEMSRIAVQKAFTGDDLEGHSEGEGLFCGMNDPEAGAGYVVSERFTGRLGNRHGTFVMQHGGVMGPEVEPHTFGHVVPGSGTAELTGLVGTVEINREADGTHTFTIEYHFGEEEAA